MTWGVLFPYGSGDYSPEAADFADYEEKIERHFNEVLTDKERAEYDDWVVKFRSKIGRKYSSKGAIFEDFEKPTQLVLPRTPRNLASLFFVNRGFMIVEEALKGIIEGLEPSVHQFWSVDVQLPRGKTPDKSYFFMVIGQYLDAFLPEKSIEGAWRRAGAFYNAAWSDKKHCNGLALSAKVIRGAHLWRDEKLANPEFFISDALKSEIDKTGLRFLKHYNLIEA
ncbi:DUF1629 domain-containing protein [uncultured Ruegeria sp.]|uniref:imm11 family protein n=1 Tax=uncultured Ruegeria sp. TaxID=259304 RepID=UPI002607EAC9|nr:DUF1629 domain-containing protein [uncultured Ruegeria sp.]